MGRTVLEARPVGTRVGNICRCGKNGKLADHYLMHPVASAARAGSGGSTTHGPLPNPPAYEKLTRGNVRQVT